MALPPSGSDAAGLAHIATQAKGSAQPVVVVCAQAVDALRLMLEIPFFEPDLRCALFPDWETLPYDHFSPHHDLISERLATLWRIRQRDHQEGADVVIVAATTGASHSERRLNIGVTVHPPAVNNRHAQRPE